MLRKFVPCKKCFSHEKEVVLLYHCLYWCVTCIIAESQDPLFLHLSLWNVHGELLKALASLALIWKTKLNKVSNKKLIFKCPCKNRKILLPVFKFEKWTTQFFYILRSMNIEEAKCMKNEADRFINKIFVRVLLVFVFYLK